MALKRKKPRKFNEQLPLMSRPLYTEIEDTDREFEKFLNGNLSKIQQIVAQFCRTQTSGRRPKFQAKKSDSQTKGRLLTWKSIPTRDFRASADDLMSVALLAVWEASRTYDASLNNSFWMYAQVRVKGAILDYLKFLRGAPQAGGLDHLDPETPIESVEFDGRKSNSDLTPLETLLENEKYARLQRAVQMLTPEQRSVWNAAAHGARIDQIATNLRISIVVAHCLLRQAEEFLRRQMADDLEKAG